MVPIVSVLLVVGLLIGILIWYLKCYRKRHLNDEEDKSEYSSILWNFLINNFTVNKPKCLSTGRPMNMYITDGRSGLATNFDYSKCSSEIKTMLETRKVPIEDLDLKEEIGKGE